MRTEMTCCRLFCFYIDHALAKGASACKKKLEKEENPISYIQPLGMQCDEYNISALFKAWRFSCSTTLRVTFLHLIQVEYLEVYCK